MSLDSAIEHLLTAKRISAASQSYAKDNPLEWEKVKAYLQGGSRPSGVATEMGLGLLEVEDERRLVEPPPPPPPDPEPPAGGYFVADYTVANSFASPWSLLFSYSDDGTHAVPAAQTPEGRCSIVANPSGSGKVARFEQRDSDSPWPPLPDTQKSEVRSGASQTWDGSLQVGDVHWFKTFLYLPYTANEKFEWPHGGSKPFLSICDIHTGSSTGWSHFQLGMQAFQVRNGDNSLPLYMNIYGGNFPETTHFEGIPLFNLTNSSGGRVAANHNRWIELEWGMRMAPDSTGWLEVWVDDVNIYPRKNRPTMWAGDFNSYFKYGLYRQDDSTFPESGRSVLYYGRTTIGRSKS